MTKYTLADFTLCAFFIISFLFQACGQDVDELKRTVENETGITIKSGEVHTQGSDIAPGDFTEYFTLQLDSLNFISVVTQIKAHESYIDTVIQFPDIHNFFAIQDEDQIQTRRWTRAPFGYRYIHELHNRGIEFIICEVDTESRTFSFRYVQE